MIEEITDLLKSDSNTIILVVLEPFSCSLCLIQLPGLPNTFELAEMMFYHVFCYFSLPEDMVSNRGPQFTSQV